MPETDFRLVVRLPVALLNAKNFAFALSVKFAHLLTDLAKGPIGVHLSKAGKVLLSERVERARGLARGRSHEPYLGLARAASLAPRVDRLTVPTP